MTAQSGTDPRGDIVPAADAKPEPPIGELGSRRADFWNAVRRPNKFHPYVVATVAAALGAAVAGMLTRIAGSGELIFLMLPAALLTGARCGMLPGLYATVLGALFYEAIVAPEAIRFTARMDNVFPLVTYLAVSIAAVLLMGRLWEQVLASRRREARLRALIGLSRDIAGATGSKDVLRAVVHRIDEILDARTIVLLPSEQDRLEPAYPPGAELSPADREAAERALRSNVLAGCGADTQSGALRLYQPMRANDRVVGVLGMAKADAESFRNPEFRWLLESMASLAALAIARMDLARQIADDRVIAEAESLRSALLSSISHDLRTPLATIIGSASTLQRYGANLDEETRKDLLTAIREEAERLNRFVRNLLDMTKLESGSIVPKKQWVALEDLIGAALEKLGERLEPFDIQTELAPDLPLVHVDFVLMEQVLVNLLDNALKFSPPGGRIEIAAQLDRAAERFRIEVRDQGPGIPAKDLARIFDKFYRAQHRDRKAAGTGLGLSICKGLVEAHGGAIYAESDGDRQGSRFRVELPLERQDMPSFAKGANAELS